MTEQESEAMELRRMIMQHVPPTAVPTERRWSTDMMAELPAFVRDLVPPPLSQCTCSHRVLRWRHVSDVPTPHVRTRVRARRLHSLSRTLLTWQTL